MRDPDFRLRIRWAVADGASVEGVCGIDSETVPVDDLVRWAKRRRRTLRRARCRAFKGGA